MSVDKFQFWSKSSDKEPGKGTGEYVDNVKEYKELIKTKDWRKMLSNFYISSFVLDGKTWASVEHFYHATKFRDFDNKDNFNYYETFALESNSPWSKEPQKAWIAGQAGKPNSKGIIPSKKIDNVNIPKNVKMLNNFDNDKTGKKAMTIAFLAKFTQNEMLKNALLNTNNAELWHFRTRGKDPEYWDHLMRVRECIRKYDNEIDLKEYSNLSSEFVSKLLSSDTSIILSKEEIRNYHAHTKVAYKNKKATIIARNYHPDGKRTYNIRLISNNKILEYVPENKVYKIS
jgi:predicted NAD-dependent protein-ADP-ribosyltransferase YbiA (DUF1768 family)